MKRRNRKKPRSQTSQPLAPTQKKIEDIIPSLPVNTTQNNTSSVQYSEQIEALIAARTRESHWLVPTMVFMVVGATIYLAILNNKVEYVYSLASACFGFYFGQIAPRSFNTDIKKTN